MVTGEAVTAALRHLGLSGRPVCVHASLRSFGRVEDGAPTVVDGLLAEGCTVVVPTFSWRAFAVPPPRAWPPQNAWDYDSPERGMAGTDRVYTPDTDAIDEDMGAIPATVIAKAGRVRGDHPLCSFSAVGPLADELIGKQQPVRVWGALEALCEHEGAVVLMGVGLDTMSLLHLAEQRAGRNPFRRWAKGFDGNTMEVEVGGCSGGFGNFEPALAPLESQTKVGTSVWRVFAAQATVDAAARAIRHNPIITHCGDPGCGRCRDAAAGGPLLEGWGSQDAGSR